MRKFKVIALSVSGRGKKIYSSGDEVDENGFPEGIADELVKGNYIREITDEVPAKNEEDGLNEKKAKAKKSKV